MSKAENIRSIISLLAATLMVGVAELAGEKEIIFPELVALTVGLWIIDKRVWRVRGWQIVFMMTLGAVAGVCIVRYLHLPHFVNLTLAFALAAGILLLFCSTLIPLLSACILPVLLHTEEWVYPVAVFAMTSTLVAGQWLMEKGKLRHRTTYIPAGTLRERGVGKWLSMLLVVLVLCALSQFTQYSYLIIPPLIVTFVELATSRAGFRNRPTQIFFFLVFAVFMGTVFQVTGIHYFHLPQTVVAFMIALCLFVVFRLTGKYFAPAGAMAYIPMIVPQETLWTLPFQATVGAALFISVAMIVYMKCYKWKRTQLVYAFTPSFLRRYVHGHRNKTD